MVNDTKVKICGITTEEDIFEVARLGADFIGYIFYPPSPRYITPERAGELTAYMRKYYPDVAPKTIGVFVDESPEHIQLVCTIAGLDGVQFSGDEPPESVAAVKADLVFRGLSLETLDRLGQYEADVYLCDTHAPEEKGGTGRSYDYDQLRPFLEQYRIVVAGGLTPETVGGVVSRLHPWGVDVSSALEMSPGKKDLLRTRAFIEAVRTA